MPEQINEYIVMFINIVGCATIGWYIVKFGMSLIFNAIDKLSKNKQKEKNTADCTEHAKDD